MGIMAAPYTAEDAEGSHVFNQTEETVPWGRISGPEQELHLYGQDPDSSDV